MEKHNVELTKVKNSLLSVRKQRGEMFMVYFNRVAEEMPKIYRHLTGLGGTASVLITDSTEMPFESQIVFDFCPAGKRHGTDIEQLSGGEKSIAALSYMLALAAVTKPHMMIMDEVDAFLDTENVQYVTKYFKEHHTKT